MSMQNPTVVLVIASNREDQFRAWVDAWWDDKNRQFPWDRTILVQDGEGIPRFTPDAADGDSGSRRWAGIIHYTWSDIGKGYPGLNLPGWLSRRDSGIKSWGFLKAVTEHGADVVMALDDDCMPSDLGADPSWYRVNPPLDYSELKEHARANFVDQHLHALTRTRRWTTTVPGFVPRGMPYGRPDPLIRENSLGRMSVSLNMGLWSCIPDRDSVHELTNRDPQGYYKTWKPKKADYHNTRVMSPKQYWPLCGMNMAFRRSIAPLMYFPRMGDGTPFRRFDDIWCGVIAQKCLRHLNRAASVGKPIVSHEKASDPMTNLVNESPGIRANEEFWQVIDRLSLNGCDTPTECMVQLGEQLRDFGSKVEDPNLKTYLPQLGKWMIEWVLEFHKAGWDEDAPE
jgi:hypothetical protein